MDNIKDLRHELIDAFNEIKSGSMDHKKAKDIMNVAGKIMTSTKLEMDYARLIKETRTIEFMEYEEPVKPKKVGRPRKNAK